METKSEEPIVIYYPTWMKVISWVGVPVLTLIALWLITRTVWEGSMSDTKNYVGMALGFAVLYQCVIGLFGLQYLNTKLLILDEGLKIYYKNSAKLLPWSRIAKMTEFTFSSTTRLSDSSGVTILYASDSMKNFNILKRMLNEMHG